MFQVAYKTTKRGIRKTVYFPNGEIFKEWKVGPFNVTHTFSKGIKTKNGFYISLPVNYWEFLFKIGKRDRFNIQKYTDWEIIDD